MSDSLSYYSSQSLMTEPRQYADSLVATTEKISELCRIVQAALVHVFWAERYGLASSKDREKEVSLRSLPRKLTRLLELDPRPIEEPRPLERRLYGNCRDFSLMLAALLRSKRIPARLRCGFGAYFIPNHFEDHWVCEYWNSDEERWILVDSQLDDFQRDSLHISFDPLDVPRDQFISGGRAWQLCRSGMADPETFGIFDMKGLWFVRGNLVRDAAALNKDELLPWDAWGIINVPDDSLTWEDLALLDCVAELTYADVPDFDALRELYRSDARLTVPPEIRSYTENGVETVLWGEA